MYIFIPEYKNYESQLTGYTPNYTVLLIGLCISLCIARLIDRQCKFSLVVHTSTMFFASVDAAMKIIAGFGSIIFFNEGITWTELVGFLLIIISFIPMRIGSCHKFKNSCSSLLC